MDKISRTTTHVLVKSEELDEDFVVHLNSKEFESSWAMGQAKAARHGPYAHGPRAIWTSRCVCGYPDGGRKGYFLFLCRMKVLIC